MDEVDIAQEQEELALQSALALSRKSRGPAPSERCLNCNAPLGAGALRWCDVDCRDDWQAREDARTRGGA